MYNHIKINTEKRIKRALSELVQKNGKATFEGVSREVRLTLPTILNKYKKYMIDLAKEENWILERENGMRNRKEKAEGNIKKALKKLASKSGSTTLEKIATETGLTMQTVKTYNDFIIKAAKESGYKIEKPDSKRREIVKGLIKASFKNLIAKKGITTINEIAKGAGIAPGTITAGYYGFTMGLSKQKKWPLKMQVNVKKETPSRVMKKLKEYGKIPNSALGLDEDGNTLEKFKNIGSGGPVFTAPVGHGNY